MKILGPSPLPRLNEAVGIVLAAASFGLAFSLVSYYPHDPSWNTASDAANTRNQIGVTGSHLADLLLQGFGLAAFLWPLLVLVLAFKWFWSRDITLPLVKIAGAFCLAVSLSGLLSLADWRIYSGAIPSGGLMGMLFAQAMVGSLNLTGAVVAISTAVLISLYLVSAFSAARLPQWIAGPNNLTARMRNWWQEWRASVIRRKAERTEEKAARAEAKRAEGEKRARKDKTPELAPLYDARVVEEYDTAPPAPAEDIPIRTLDDLDGLSPRAELAPAVAEEIYAEHEFEPEPDPVVVEYTPPPPASRPPWEEAPVARAAEAPRRPVSFQLPPTLLLNEAEARTVHDAIELKEIAGRIKSKFEEFHVLGQVVQINPGPVVTTFELKPEAGIKYSRITNLTEDLCLGLQAESILIERIPGKPTVGIEVPNSRRELIALRQILESDEFVNSPSKMSIPLGKDISGRIKVHSLETMPHLLIAGSTGSGKSVMLNSLIMAILFKATPEDVRMILVDPKRVEMGPYEDIPHLLTPVITDPRKATNALRNAVLEMERRLKLLASQGVRNIDQFNKKVRQLMAQPKNLFEEESGTEELKPLPYILIIIDELADLMMLERAGVEESVTRLAQMARAAGIHLVLATQRPSVDVITGLIKANFPARISFRVATRVDSRTILDVMGAEHLLGKGDMLFLPPGSSRLTRVHAAYVTETEIAGVTDFWKKQARPDYDQSYLIAPPSDEDEVPDGLDDFNDPMYEDAVRVVLEVGKASTSTLQRRLRLGYGRAARILDMMYKEGIIGPPDGSRPRDVLKRPEWLKEVEDQVR
ncbi:MAG: DNA translocase FtsK [Acidobacteria bacterium]|nr:DNA translocase FtsK [Acidobacteriota bacterium]